MSTIYLMRLKSFGLIMAILAIVASNAFAEDRRASDPGPYVDNDSFTAVERNEYNIRNDPASSSQFMTPPALGSSAQSIPAAATLQPSTNVTIPATVNVPPRRASEPGPYVNNDSFTPLERDAYNIRNDPTSTIPGVSVAPIHTSTMTNPITVYPTSSPVYTRGSAYASSPVYYNQVMPSYGMGYSNMASYSGLPRRASDPMPYPENDSFTSFEKNIYNLRR